MNKNNNQHDHDTIAKKIDAKKTDQSRREFLKKSKYAAYATPLITGLIIEKAAAAGSSGTGGF